MGIDLLDLNFRMAKQFRLKLDMTFWGDILASAQQESPRTPVTDFTVGQVHRELVQRLKHEGSYVQTSYIAEENFKDVQSKLSARFPSQVVAPETKLQDLFSHQLWREDWYELSEIVGVEMPPFGRSRWPRFVLGLGFVALSVCSLPMMVETPTIEIIASISIALISILMTWCLSCVPPRFPAQNWTVNQLADHVLLARTSEDGDSKWSDDLVWIALREIVCDTLGVEGQAVTADALLFRDLGAS